MQRFIIAVIVTLAVIATTYAETTCQSHQRNSRSSAHGLGWDITCNEKGEYEPSLQCTKGEERDKWCSCYDKEKAVTGPSKKRKFCECPLAQEEAKEAGTCIPQCVNTGKWDKKQCCGEGANRKCRCVNPDTGAQTREPTTDANLTC